MAYRYTCPIETSTTYISFDVPDNFMAGETITVQGEIHNADYYRIKAISFEAWPQNYAFPYYQTPGCVSSGSSTLSIASGKTSPFSFSFSVQDISGKLSSTSSYANPLKFGFCVEYIRKNGAKATIDTCEVSDERLAYLLYRCNPRILEMDFERCGPSGAWQDDGQYFRCKALRISKDAQAAVSIFSKKTILCTGTDGSSRSFSLTSSQLSAAFSSSGYSESGYSSSNICYGFTSALGVTYTLTLTVGDAYDQDSYSDKVNRAFARLHFSGASDGGVAVGMFSSATNGHPKFEVAENHESHFYGPVYFEGGTNGAGGDYSSGEVDTGRHWIDGKPIYRFCTQVSVNLSAGDSKAVCTFPSKMENLIYSHITDQVSTSIIIGGHNSQSGKQLRGYYIDTSTNQLMIHLGANAGGSRTFTVILEYTKA